MNKNVVAAVFRLDKAEAFLGVKPLHCTCIHQVFLSHTRRSWRADLRPAFRLVDVWRMSETCAPSGAEAKAEQLFGQYRCWDHTSAVERLQEEAAGSSHHGWCICSLAKSRSNPMTDHGSDPRCSEMQTPPHLHDRTITAGRGRKLLECLHEVPFSRLFLHSSAWQK